MKKIDLKTSLLLSSICFISGFLVVPYQLNILKATLPEQYKEVMSTLPFSISVLSLITSIQLFVLAFVLAFIGMKLARKAGLSIDLLESLVKKEKIRFNKKAFLLSALFGLLTAFSITASDRFYFQMHVPALNSYTPSFSPLGLFAGVLYGGIFEEILLRLFFMSLLIWIFIKLFQRNKGGLHGVYYWIATFTAAALFAAAHLPATELLLGELTPLLIIRCFLLNGIGGIFFGYLFWKKGFEYAVFAHMFSHITLQLVFIPIFY